MDLFYLKRSRPAETKTAHFSLTLAFTSASMWERFR